jgi:hypothetical protein
MGRMIVVLVPPAVYTKLRSWGPTLYHECGICAATNVMLVTFWRGVDKVKRAFARSVDGSLSRLSMLRRTICLVLLHRGRTKKEE